MKTLLLALCFCSAVAFAADPTDGEALHKLYPKLGEPRDYTLTPQGALDTWKISNRNYPRPTTGQLATAKAQIVSAAATVETVRAGLLAKLAELPAGERALYGSVHAAVKAKLALGDLNGAKQIIATAPAPTPTLQAAQTAMLALFP